VKHKNSVALSKGEKAGSYLSYRSFGCFSWWPHRKKCI